jgi:hypothetical protein
MGAAKEEPWINLTMAGTGIYNRLIDATLPMGISLSYRLVYFDLIESLHREQHAAGIEFEWRWSNPLRADQAWKSTFTISRYNALGDKDFAVEQAAQLLAQQVRDMMLKMILKK